MLKLLGANAGCTDWVVVFLAWQEVVQQEQGSSQGPDEAQGAVHYKETIPSPNMDSKYSFSSFHPPKAAHVFGLLVCIFNWTEHGASFKPKEICYSYEKI